MPACAAARHEQAGREVVRALHRVERALGVARLERAREPERARDQLQRPLEPSEAQHRKRAPREAHRRLPVRAPHALDADALVLEHTGSVRGEHEDLGIVPRVEERLGDPVQVARETAPARRLARELGGEEGDPAPLHASGLLPGGFPAAASSSAARRSQV